MVREREHVVREECGERETSGKIGGMFQFYVDKTTHSGLLVIFFHQFWSVFYEDAHHFLDGKIMPLLIKETKKAYHFTTHDLRD